jgi:hypothetical protein
VPDAPRNDDRLAGTELEHALRGSLFEKKRDLPREEKEHLMPSGCISPLGERGGSSQERRL